MFVIRERPYAHPVFAYQISHSYSQWLICYHHQTEGQKNLYIYVYHLILHSMLILLAIKSACFSYMLPSFITNWCWCWFLHTVCGSVMLLLLIIEIKKEYVTVYSSFITFVPWFVKIRIRFKNQTLDTYSIICYHCWGIRIIVFRVEARLWVC
jgi:hypothetical protein